MQTTEPGSGIVPECTGWNQPANEKLFKHIGHLSNHYPNK